MTYNELTVLIPSHSLEDFPTELGDTPAEGLLNAFAVLWHPVLLATADAFPRWQRADEMHDVRPNRLVIVPPNCDDWLPHGWADEARQGGSTIITGLTGRREMIAAALDPLENPPSVDPDLEADFLALGHCHLQTELLTRHMRNFSNLDELHMQREAVSAAKAALSGDRVAAETHLRNCFEMLLEARERFYPVTCYLIDLCLVIPRLADEHFTQLVSRETPFNVLATAQDLAQIGESNPQALTALKAAWDAGRADVVGAEWEDAATPLMSLESVIWQFGRGLRTFDARFGRRPTTWGRRRFGVGPQMPQMISRHGPTAGLHFVMDDGIYPDEEHSKLRWQGCDASVVDALSRIPLATDSAASFLRFPVRMSESMDNDHAACVVFARWPEVRSPWLEDFRRAHKYAPVLGRFVTFREFFENSDMPGRLSDFKAGDYLSPFLVQAVARQEPDPIGRHVDYWSRRQRFDAAEWCRNLRAVLRDGRVPDEVQRADEERIESAPPDAKPESVAAAETFLQELSAAALGGLAGTLTAAGPGAGQLVVNPLSFPRKVVVVWPADAPLPEAAEPVCGRQFEEDHRAVMVDVPACGFVWVPHPATPAEPAPPGKVPTAEALVLRNDAFEVALSQVTGGIAQIRTYKRSPNRLSQQIAFRFPRERTVTVGEGDAAEQYRTYYSEMQMRSSRVLCAGPALGEIETTGDVFDQTSGNVLAEYRQVARVWRGKPQVELEIELDVKTLPDGDPWTNYIAARFAWKHEDAALTRSLHHGAHGTEAERIEAPQYLELADENFRTTIIPCGLPFHRKTGPRMLDTLLITAGETRRRFRFVIAIDEAYPLQAALDATAPVLTLPAEGAPPGGARRGWFFHLNTRNVQLTRILPLMPREKEDPGMFARATGCAVRLIETEGRHRTFKLRCFRTPAYARQRDFCGKTIGTLSIKDDDVHIETGPYEVCDVELRF